MDTNIYRVGPRMAREYVIEVCEAGLVPMLTGSPGGGKSSIMRSIALQYFRYLIDHRMSTSVPEDFNGLPRFLDDGSAVFAPFSDIFPLHTRPIPEGMKGFFLFLDEFNAAEEDVQAAGYKPVLDKMIGQHALHPETWMALAGNLKTDRAIVNDLSTAMQSRLIHIELMVVFREWLEDVAFAEDYDYRVIAYLSKFNDKLMNFDPNHDDKTFDCPRTWSFMNKLIKGKTFREIDVEVNGIVQKQFEMDRKTPLYAGTISSGTAAEFVRFCRIGSAVPELEDILADPTGFAVPESPDLMWIVISSLLGKVKEDNFTSLSMYINRFEMTFKLLFYRSVQARNRNLVTHPAFVQARLELARYLNG